MNLKLYADQIATLAAELGRTKVNAKGFNLGAIAFRHVEIADLDVTLSKLNPSGTDHGVLCKRLPVDVRRGLERARVSYITENGHIALFLGDRAITSHPLRSSDVRPRADFVRKSEAMIPPTTLVSPASLAVLDTLFRLESLEAKSINGLQLSVKFELSQSRISRLMRAFEARDLLELKKRVAKMSKSRWLEALRYPRTAQRMTPYFRDVQYYRSVSREFSRTEAQTWGGDVVEEYAGGIFPGPIEVAKMAGILSEKTVYLWGEADAVRRLKRAYQLVPTGRDEQALCAIALPAKSMRSEAILSKIPQRGAFDLPASALTLNLFRVVWDLGFSDTRGGQAQQALLEKIFDEAQ